MSQSRSPSGFASLRAKFEQSQQDNNTSPPSRGRSPAGGLPGEQNRPLSKVRTNFVAVEPSGHMPSTLEVPATGDGTLDRAGESKSATRKAEIEPKISRTGQDASKRGRNVGSKSTANGSSTTEDPYKRSEEKSSDPNDDATNTNGLGAILKGSPFESEEHKADSPPQKRQVEKAHVQARQVSGAQVPSAGSKQKPQQPKQLQPDLKSLPTTNGAASKASKKPTTSAKGTGATKDRDVKAPSKAADQTSIPSAPPAYEKAHIESPSNFSNGGKEASKPSKEDHKATKAPNDVTGAPHSAIGSKASPATANTNTDARAGSPGKASQKASDALQKAAKAPLAQAKSKATNAKASATSSAKLQEKATVSSTGFVKPRPKSPTRPVRLPAAATATTTSAAAKHDGEGVKAPSRSPSRQSNVSVLSNKRAGSLAKPSKPARVSLPANSRQADRPKPKPRASLAPTTASSGNFLERMMRPTQSSAQKVHDKVEPKSPPRRNTNSATHAIRQKRTSGESVSSKAEREGPREASHAPEDLSKVPSRSDKDSQLQGSQTSDVKALPLTDTGAANEI